MIILLLLLVVIAICALVFDTSWNGRVSGWEWGWQIVFDIPSVPGVGSYVLHVCIKCPIQCWYLLYVYMTRCVIELK